MKRSMMFGLLGLVTLVAACSGSGDGGTGTTMPSDGGATGGSAGAGGGSSGAAGVTGSGGAGGMGTECRTTADCPQRGCYMCPGAVCENGRCVTSSGSGGATGTGGSAGSAGAGGAGTISCGTQTCGPSQACVTPCCGGAPGFQCTPPPPYCIDIPPSCQGQSLTDCLTLNSCYSPRASGRDISCTCA